MRDYQPWAYCDVRSDGTITYYGVADAHRTQMRPNVQAVDTLRWVEEAVAWLGTQGWELISVVERDDGRTFYFKRPVQDQTADVDAEAISLEAATATDISLDRRMDDAPEVTRVDPARLIEEEFLPDS
jgi:hypothetical protein